MNLLKLITPINLVEEKERFFSSNTYEPIFKYNWNKDNLKKWSSQRPYYQKLVGAVLKQDHQSIVKEAKSVFQTKISQYTLTKAHEVVKKSKPHVLKTDVYTLAQKFSETFQYFDINYTVKIVDKHGFNLKPSYSDKSLIISKHLRLDFFSAEGEMCHELTHIIRKVNGDHNGIKRSTKYLPTEEGLATYLQDNRGKEINYSHFQHAAEYFITKVGLESGLRNMVDAMCEYGFQKELAWQRAVRHKFGFVDTSKPGDIMKPSMYFYRAQKVKKLSSDEKLRLMVGKISLNELGNYKKYEGSIPEHKIKTFYEL